MSFLHNNVMVAKKESASKNKDAIEVLIQQHKGVQKMFKDFEKLKEGDEEEKAALVNESCANLKIHTKIEEDHPARTRGHAIIE